MVQKTGSFFPFTPIGFVRQPQDIDVRRVRLPEGETGWSRYTVEEVLAAAAIVRLCAKQRRWVGLAAYTIEAHVKRQLIWQHGILVVPFVAMWLWLTKAREPKRIAREGLGRLERDGMIHLGRFGSGLHAVRIIYPSSPLVDLFDANQPSGGG